MAQDLRKKARDILSSMGDKRYLIPILQEVQARMGYLPREALEEVGRFLGQPSSRVWGVATFYNQFRFLPPSRHHIKVCLGTACHMKGGQVSLECWERELGIKAGEVTPDLEFGLERVACVGCCAMAPVSVVDEAPQGKVTPTRVKGILLSFRLKKPD